MEKELVIPLADLKRVEVKLLYRLVRLTNHRMHVVSAAIRMLNTPMVKTNFPMPWPTRNSGMYFSQVVPSEASTTSRLPPYKTALPERLRNAVIRFRFLFSIRLGSHSGVNRDFRFDLPGDR
ncbi:MAG: hypothetical protein ABR953_10395 [Candidatus Acidiferrales bacterium]|jgi:hypothetical protein